LLRATESARMAQDKWPRASAVIVAAGDSTRMGPGSARKPLTKLAGRTVLEHVCAAFDPVASVSEIVVVAHPADIERIGELRGQTRALAKVRAVVPGGAQRTHSVRAGVAAASEACEIVLVHDAARPLIRSATIAGAIDVAAREGAALVALPVNDTLKSSSDGARATETIDRSKLWSAQTPQAFRAKLFRELLARAEQERFVPTDDAALYERYVGPIALVPGDPTNLKITTPEDLVLAEAILAARNKKNAMTQRIGLGFDVHRLVEGRRCVLGGIELPHASGPLGHSDGDAVLHAIGDALLGAAGLDDLGSLYSDSDPKWKDADSATLLTEVAARVRSAGWRVANVDVVIATEGPRIAPHRAAMRARIAELIGIEADAVNVKGKTFEGFGELARGAGVAVQAVCLLAR
jgi:2-C-methyl-D-erythritol 4-phosphate cytidylyltransferase/2-C-methyl-D-erythritol 2,4-cyclodiphosphate synthase